ncbi:RNA polymerase-associated protein CTR9 homolog [Drosophila rhopaloa]|uniref:RNA polymerase-associated protein CTR9 homolog n=1 Tax=Drosophila rhopaloa TaxID=1041015 RepID=A0A6P4DX66_DRORH|nr:RNA polymerase-associated protein CTR9 homolog [Drosophila rhopaloa]
MANKNTEAAGMSFPSTFPLLLTTEKLSLRTWISNALVCYSQHLYDHFVHILETGIKKSHRQYSSYNDDLAKAYTLLLAHFTRLAHKELGNRRSVLLAKVMNILKLLNGMQRSGDRNVQLVRGFALMPIADRAQDADAQFVSVLKQIPTHVPALIGRGCLAFNQQDYLSSLGFFKSVLASQFSGPPDVHVGMGHCFLNMGELDRARRSFQLALEHNGRCQNALVGMALLKLNQREKESTQEGINLLCAAFERNNRHAVIMSILANHFYYAGDYEKVCALAANSYKVTDIPQLQSQNCFQIARCFHATKQFEQAMEFYTRSVRLAPEGYVLPFMGLAQMLLKRGEITKAKACLERFLKFMPNEARALLLLAKIYLNERSPGQIDKAINMLVKVTSFVSARHDFDSRLSLAFAYEQKQLWMPAIAAYHQAMSIYMEHGQQIPTEWLNNLAATQVRAKMPQKALHTLDLAIFQCRAKSGVHEVTNLLTMRFNRGRILEDLHRYDLAEIVYKEIIDDYPSYYDCYLRLGVMAMQRNQLDKANEYFKDVLNADNDSLAARHYMADCYMKLNLSKHAIVNYNVISRHTAECKDIYTLVALGNFCLEKIHSSLDRGDQSSDNTQLEKTLNCYVKILERSPRNIWAANGIGAALSSYKNLTEGQAIFKQIVEAGNECPSAILNSAHTALELGQFKEASETYKQCLQDFLPENSVEVMQLLAKALYGEGKAREAKMWLLKARHLAPNDNFLIFNLALAIIKDAEQVFVLPQPELQDLTRAELELKVAHNYFYHLYLAEDGISQLACEKGASECQNLMSNLHEEYQRVLNLQMTNRQVEEHVLRENEVLGVTNKIMSELLKDDSKNGQEPGRIYQQDVEVADDQDSNDESKNQIANNSRKRTMINENKPAKKCKTDEFFDTDDDSEEEDDEDDDLEDNESLENDPQTDLDSNLSDDEESEGIEELLDRIKKATERRRLERQNFMKVRENYNE